MLRAGKAKILMETNVVASSKEVQIWICNSNLVYVLNKSKLSSWFIELRG